MFVLLHYICHLLSPSYAILGLEKLGIPREGLTPGLLEGATQLTARWKDVVAFYTIRLALAPAVEALLLLDRLTFLQEHGGWWGSNTVVTPFCLQM